MPADPALYPVVLDLAGRRCLVVGGGTVAAGKVAGLVTAGALVTVVAPHVGPAIQTIADADAEAEAEAGGLAGSVTVHRRPYRTGEAADYRLVFTATGIGEVDGAVAADADGAGIWVNSADDPARCSFTLPSVHRDGPVNIAVSTGGASPALAIWLRRRIGQALGPSLGTLALLLEGGRRQLQATGRPTESVDWQTLLDGPLPELVRQGRLPEARQLLAEAAGVDLV
ncbi:MAG TPA: bifunctional precorrin-2 dehydrogenase/sirohydrochlorin ferrochelatase [Acidimicrobiales bacterium]|nr:bifunctional precorrin-2 dehydrogenase/sirohydrochlorin ferrochelatase [Acidimicrobiales bacterium]